MQLTDIDIDSLIEKGERLRVECKEALGGFPETLWETYSAFANTDGGFILLGVKENPDHSLSVQGINDPAVLIKTFGDLVNNGPSTVSLVRLSKRNMTQIGRLCVPQGYSHIGCERLHSPHWPTPRRPLGSCDEGIENE